MKPIPKEFKYKKSRFKQILREENIAIYEREDDTPDGRIRKQFEVIKIQNHNGRECFGKKIPPTEYYPSTTQWGHEAFSYLDFNMAKERFYKLIKIEQNKEKNKI